MMMKLRVTEETEGARRMPAGNILISSKHSRSRVLKGGSMLHVKEELEEREREELSFKDLLRVVARGISSFFRLRGPSDV